MKKTQNESGCKEIASFKNIWHNIDIIIGSSDLRLIYIETTPNDGSYKLEEIESNWRLPQENGVSTKGMIYTAERHYW